EASHAITGIAFVNNEVWLSSKAPSRGSLYKAALPELANFAPVLDSVPKLACISVVNNEPFVCANDYSADSPFLLAKVNRTAQRFEPVLALNELGKLKDCGAACRSTHDWLEDVYGSGNDTDAETTGETNSGPSPEAPARSDDGGCTLRMGSRDVRLAPSLL